jgi:hypothetical protein
MRITASGVLELTQGQIKFPATQVASSDANTLDDYEEGTFDFGIAFGGADTGITYAGRPGKYTKIGRQVTVTGQVALTSKGSATGSAQITGLPFVIFNADGNVSMAVLRLEDITFVGQFVGTAGGGGSVIGLGQTSEAGTTTALTNANFTNSSFLFIALTYFVS